jgi:hypothetical protein
MGGHVTRMGKLRTLFWQKKTEENEELGRRRNRRRVILKWM